MPGDGDRGVGFGVRPGSFFQYAGDPSQNFVDKFGRRFAKEFGMAGDEVDTARLIGQDRACDPKSGTDHHLERPVSDGAGHGSPSA